MAARAALPLVLAALLLPGCSWLLGPPGGAIESGAGEAALPVEELAAANVRNAAPAIEAYFVDRLSYAGATPKALRAYDPSVAGIRVPHADEVSYCIESTVNGTTMHMLGPGGDVEPGFCPDLGG